MAVAADRSPAPGSAMEPTAVACAAKCPLASSGVAGRALGTAGSDRGNDVGVDARVAGRAGEGRPALVSRRACSTVMSETWHGEHAETSAGCGSSQASPGADGRADRRDRSSSLGHVVVGRGHRVTHRALADGREHLGVDLDGEAPGPGRACCLPRRCRDDDRGAASFASAGEVTRSTPLETLATAAVPLTEAVAVTMPGPLSVIGTEIAGTQGCDSGAVGRAGDAEGRRDLDREAPASVNVVPCGVLERGDDVVRTVPERPVGYAYSVALVESAAEGVQVQWIVHTPRLASKTSLYVQRPGPGR